MRPSRPKTRLKIALKPVAAGLIACIALGGCGQKGALYLPAPAASSPSSSSTVSP